MGFKYEQPIATMKPRKTQIKLSDYFNSKILIPSIHLGYEKNMENRTAAFTTLYSAEYLFYIIKKYTFETGFEPVIVKVKLTENLLRGEYGASKVVAGTSMEILEEIDIEK